MKRLLYHVCDFDVDVLNPNCYKENAICLSEGIFIGSLGQWLYIFEFEVLNKDFVLHGQFSGGQEMTAMVTMDMGFDRLSFCSVPLGKEFRIYRSIDVHRYALGVAQNFNVLKGVLKEFMNGEIIKRVRMNNGNSQTLATPEKPRKDEKREDG